MKMKLVVLLLLTHLEALLIILISQERMLRTCTLTTSRPLSVIAHFAIRVVRRDAGVKVPKIARNSARQTVRLNVPKEDVLGRSQENVVIW